ncbi:MAG: hypothetical protein GY895_22020, partial [Phycisphaera sp.]|nr:hypothetical protein [Phycisphaera sp.]
MPRTEPEQPEGVQSAATRGLWNRNFTGLVITQFAGATNDNVLKTVLLLQFAKGQKW